jgi:uncharacterized membrane protein YcgQ (UPF0703/DUF1980 family)
MKTIWGYIEALILILLGLYMGALVFIGGYWRYMNPRFEWLTAAAAIMFIITGGIAFLRPNKQANLSAVIIFIAFMGIVAIGSATALRSPSTKSDTNIEESTEDSSRLTFNDLEYIKINLAEIYQHCLDHKADKIADRYVVRGIAKRTPALDKAKQFVVLRTAVVCCLAHAAPVGFRVQYKEPDKIVDGQWIRIYGTLKKLPPDAPDPELHIRGLFFVRLNRTYGILPTEIVKIPEPEVPYIFNFHSAEPYAY